MKMDKDKKEHTGVLVAVSPITIKEREKKYGGGLLDSDRQRYQEGDEVDLTEGKIQAALADQEEAAFQSELTEGKIGGAIDDQEEAAFQREIIKGKIEAAEKDKSIKEDKKLNLLDKITSLYDKVFKDNISKKDPFTGQDMKDLETEYSLDRGSFQEGGLLSPDEVPLPQETAPLPVETSPLPEEIDTLPDETMPPSEEPMVPDEEMEDNYLDFVVSQSLDEGEETYLMDTLEADEKLSVIFDKVLDTASEFAGSGPVEGPGSEVSDSIPARLSDGEFVMTAKAADEIGPDNLQGMMSDAELRADQRQAAQEGGLIREDLKEKTGQTGPPVDQEIRRGMLGVNPRLQTTR